MALNADSQSIFSRYRNLSFPSYSFLIQKLLRVRSIIFVIRVFFATNSGEIWGYSSAGRAPALQAGGQRFEPAYLHHKTLRGIKCPYFHRVGIAKEKMCKRAINKHGIVAQPVRAHACYEARSISERSEKNKNQ